MAEDALALSPRSMGMRSNCLELINPGAAALRGVKAAYFIGNAENRPVRGAALKQRETVRQAFSVTGEAPMPSAPSTPLQQRAPVQQSHSSPATGTSKSHHKKLSPFVPSSEDVGMAKRRKLQMQPPLDVKEYLDNDSETGLQQRIGEGPERPFTPELIFVRKMRSQIKQPVGRCAWTFEEVVIGFNDLYRRLPQADRAAYEREADDMQQRYKDEWRKIQKGNVEGKERGGSATSLEIYDANNRKRLEQQHPGMSASELTKRLKKDFEALSAENRRPYTFLAERDRERVRVHRSLWQDKLLSITGGEPGGNKREFYDVIPQYCVFCGHSLINTREKSCQNCGKMYEAKITAFAIGGYKELNLHRHLGQSAADESTLVTID